MLEFESDFGSHITKDVEDAIKLAKEQNELVHFNFNEIDIYVNEFSLPGLVVRDFLNSYKLGVKSIGPAYIKEYDEKTLAAIKKYDAEEAIREAERTRIYKEEELAKKLALETEVKDEEIEITDQENWDDRKTKNADDYGAAILRYAEHWATLMQAQAKKEGKEIDMQFIIDHAREASFKADVEGITGFMYGAAVSVLAKCWKYGELLRKWHNKEYSNDGDGIVNPAVLTIKAD
jgi:hypothetical protein